MTYMIIHRRRVYAHVVKAGHPLDGRLVEVTGRGRGMVVYIRPVMGDENEYELRNDEIREVVPATPDKGVDGRATDDSTLGRG